MLEICDTNNAYRALPRWVALTIGAFVVLVSIFITTEGLWIDVISADFFDGAVVAVWLTAGYGYGSVFAPRALRASACDDDALLRWVSMIALGLGAIGLITLGLGLAGLLSRPVAIGILGFGLLLAGRAARGGSTEKITYWLRERICPSALLLAFPLAIAVIGASLSPGFLWKPLDPHPYDVLSYHLQIPREWYDAGQIIPLRHNSFSFFPMGMEMHDLLAMHLLGGPWAGMYLCQFMSVAFGALTVLGVIGAVRAFGGSKTIAILAGLATASIPWTTMLSSVAYVESGVMCYTLLAVIYAARSISYFPPLAGGTKGGVLEHDQTIRSSLPPTPPSPAGGEGVRLSSLLTPAPLRLPPFLLACVLAAFACGMKYTAIPMTAAPVILLFPFFIVRAHGRRWISTWFLGCALCGLLVAPWLIRNMVWTGNPVFPLAAKVFGSGHFSADQVDRYLTAHAPPVAERSIGMRLFVAWNRVVIDPQFGCGILVSMSLLAMALTWRARAMRFITVVVIAASLVWLLATHDIPRFLTPIIPLMCVLIGVAASRGRITQWIGGTLLIIQAVIGLRWTCVTLQPAIEIGRLGVFRMADLSVIETEETQAARTSGDKVALIGDAQAFFYVMPSDKLLYRGVFDVNIPPGVSTVDGWLGKSVDQLRHEGYWVVINTSELNRLSETYAHISKPLPPYDQPQSTPTVLRPLR